MTTVPEPLVLPLHDQNGEKAGSVTLAMATATSYPALMIAPGRWLDAADLRRVRGFPVEKRRREFVLGRYSCKLAAAQVLTEPVLSRIAVESGAFGQPILCYPAARHPELAISHGGEVALAVVAPPGCPVGIDIEPIQDRPLDSLREHVTEHDLARLAALGDPPVTAALRVWTIKEAVAKALRCGLSMPFNLLDFTCVSPPAHRHAHCRFQNFPLYRCHSWVLGRYAVAFALPWTVCLEPPECDMLADWLSARLG